MLRVVVSSNAGAAKSYFTGSLSRGDYYREEQERAGVWRGLGAEWLCLWGFVGREQFFSLCENVEPGTERSLTPRTKSGRRVGYDLNFHAPKSASLLYALGGDLRIVDVFQQAVSRTMGAIEREMRTRVRVGGQSGDRVTGNMTWAEFLHTTARPVDGVPDPHLHMHCFTINATYDQVETRWKAGEFANIKRDAPLHEAVFHSWFATGMRELGYEIRPSGRFWEVASVPEQLIRDFSRRTQQIERVAVEKGVRRDPVRMAELGVRTREAKNTDLSFEQLRAAWRVRAGGADLKIPDGTGPTAKHALPASTKTVPPWATMSSAEAPALDKNAAMAVQWAVDHVFERKAVTRKSEVLEQALRRSFGKATPDAVKLAFAEYPFIEQQVGGTTLLTTEEVWKEERRMLKFVRDGRGRCPAFVRGDYHMTDATMSLSQHMAVSHVLASYDRVTVIRGAAGTGKTRLTKEAVERLTAAGHEVVMLAPTAGASRGVLREAGFKEADTVARLLASEQMQQKAKGAVLWVDEAGLIGTRTMTALFDVADKLKSRVILTGDERQHRPVERGDALRLIATDGGIQPADVRGIQRQCGEFREAVEQLASGRSREAWQGLEKLGFVKEMKVDEAHRAAARECARLERTNKSYVLISPSRREGEELTNAVRQEFRKQGLLDEWERSLPCLKPKHWTAAEKREATQYQKGQVIEFSKNARGFRAGDRTEVMGTDPFGNVWVRGALGVVTPVLLDRSNVDRFAVFDQETMSMSKGEKVRITKNGLTEPGLLGKAHRLNAGSVYQVKSMGLDGSLKLTNGWRVGGDFGHVEYGYCDTSHASQGKTVDRAVIVQTEASYGASSAEQLYVSVSRAKESCLLLTDSKPALYLRVTRAPEAGSATELKRVALEEHLKGLGVDRKPEPVRDRERERQPEVEREPER